MRVLVLDTSVIIDFTRGLNDLLIKVIRYASIEQIPIYIPTVVLFEVFVGQEMRKKKQRENVLKMLSRFKRVKLTEEIAFRAAEIARVTNAPFDIADYVIAATTFSLKAELVTRNIKHFRLVKGLAIFNDEALFLKEQPN